MKGVSRAVFWQVAFGAMSSLGCSRGVAAVDRPTALLSASTSAQTEWAELRLAWEQQDSERAKLREPLEDFLRRHPSDPQGALARVYLAFILMDEENFLAADVLLARLERLPPGSARDLFTIAKARSFRHREFYDLALEMLRPLVGKIVDPYERELFLEQLSLAAIDAKLDYEAMAYLDGWLRGGSEDDRARIRPKIVLALRKTRRDVLLSTYQIMRTRTARYTRDMETLVGDRLGEIAVAEGDAALARWLLDPKAGASGSPSTTGLGELATSKRGLRTVNGRTIGLLLSSGTPLLRERSADVARGVSFALGLPRPRARADDPGVRLLTRDDRADTPQTALALEEMTGEGASVIVAGVDAASAQRALDWCDKHGVAVVLLHPPSTRGRGFVVGDARTVELSALAAAAVRTTPRINLVTEAEGDRALEVHALEEAGLSLAHVVGCETPPARAGLPRFPFVLAPKEKRPGWLVSGTSSCARDAVAEVLAFGPAGSPLFMTLEAASTDYRYLKEAGARLEITTTAAGAYPILASRSEEAKDPDIAAFMAQDRERPSWWTGLGHDAALLAARAVLPLPLDGVVDERLVTQRRAIVEAGLLAARRDLWTTRASGFDAERVLPRTFGVVAWTAR